ncbi:MAG: hypothetical protein HC897_07090 [Thermoanaerobaculia bacterium]|nr:hypothetical protein [Thermoanaerobaculia bacterium]
MIPKRGSPRERGDRLLEWPSQPPNGVSCSLRANHDRCPEQADTDLDARPVTLCRGCVSEILPLVGGMAQPTITRALRAAAGFASWDA